MIDQLQRHVVADHDFYLDTNLIHNTRRVLMSVLADAQGVGLFSTYSSYCYVVASVMLGLLLSRNVRARLVDCKVLIQSVAGTYVVGQGYGRPGQIDSHVACLADESVLIDFGLGSVSKYLIPGFAQGVACALTGGSPELTSVRLPNGSSLTWLDAPEPPEKANILQQQHTLVETLLDRSRPR